MPDIDIDFPDRSKILDQISCITASRLDQDQLVKHNTGIYMHEVPFDCLKNVSSITYDLAEDLGFFKIDLLNVGIYKGIKDEEHLIRLMETVPLWDLLEQDEFSNLLFHVNGYGDILRVMKPRSVEQLAAILGMIRPAKRHLVGKDWDYVLEEIWKTPESDEYHFKKSHATAYAMAIIVQMNLICEPTD
jgi:hypothetical protein